MRGLEIGALGNEHPYVTDSSYIENSRASLRENVIAEVISDQWEIEVDTLSSQGPQSASSSSVPRPPPGPPPRKRGSIARAEALHMEAQQPKTVSISSVPREPLFPPPRTLTLEFPKEPSTPPPPKLRLPKCKPAEPKYPPPSAETSLRPHYLLPDSSLLFVWGIQTAILWKSDQQGTSVAFVEPIVNTHLRANFSSCLIGFRLCPDQRQRVRKG